MGVLRRASANLQLGARVVVLSPHLDDAVLSLGATIARTARSGSDVKVVTVFAGNPDSTAPAGRWDRFMGFHSAGESCRARRAEDRLACERLGATPVWLPFNDDQYGRGADDDEVWAAMATAVEDAETVLVPGFPLEHPDHRWLTRVVLVKGLAGARIGLYAEQPYTWRKAADPTVPELIRPLVKGPARWMRLPAQRADRRAKVRAGRTYRSQLPLLGRLALWRIVLYEARSGGEGLALISDEHTGRGARDWSEMRPGE